MRLIDADKLRAEFELCREESTDKERWDDVIERLDSQTVADPVLHAEWLYDRPGHWFCSNCHLTEGWASKWMKYCPLCGAKMDKENCDE